MNAATTVFPSSEITVDQVFDYGKYTPKAVDVRAKAWWQLLFTSTTLPPLPLLIYSPTEAGEFPVLMFLQGFLLSNSYYSNLLEHIASHGYVVVMPQFKPSLNKDASPDIKITAKIITWLSQNLGHHLPPNVLPNLSKLSLAGHSRGGKVAFALALGRSTPPVKFSALIGVGPIDGKDKDDQTPPPVLTYKPQSFDLGGTPVMVIGAGLGEVSLNPLFPPCAPKGVNHKDFYNECSKPAYYFVVKDYGHMDMLDDTKFPLGWTTYCLCKNGESRKPMRRFVGGAVVAFLRAYLEGYIAELVAIRNGTASLPVVLQEADSRV